MQQDAEECWTQLMLSFGQQLPKVKSITSGNEPDEKPTVSNSAISQIFGGELMSTLSNKESPDEPKTVAKEAFHKLSCHISNTTNYLIDGLKEGLEEPLTKQSELLQRQCQYLKSSKVSKLPYYLTVQFVRFFWKQDKQVKAKIVRPVEFPFTLDLFEFCHDDLKAQIQPKRKEYQENEEKKLQKEAELAKQKPNANQEQQPKKQKQNEPELDPAAFVNETGMYELIGVLTHKGRMADSGHYVGWVKEDQDKWAKYDDDKVSYVNSEEIKKLNGKGGGDWHMAYLCLYRTKKLE